MSDQRRLEITRPKPWITYSVALPTPHYSVYIPFSDAISSNFSPVLPTRNLPILKSPRIQQEAHHALQGGGGYLPCASNRRGRNQLAPFGRPSRFRADPEWLRKPRSLAPSCLQTFFFRPGALLRHGGAACVTHPWPAAIAGDVSAISRGETERIRGRAENPSSREPESNDNP